MKLVHKTQQLIAPSALLGSRIVGPVLALQQDLPLRGPVKPTHEVHQGAFARARGAHNGHGFAGLYRQVDAFQNRDIQATFCKTLVQAANFKDWFTHNAMPRRG